MGQRDCYIVAAIVIIWKWLVTTHHTTPILKASAHWVVTLLDCTPKVEVEGHFTHESESP